ncbi:MAG: TIGR03016 family PEP-CTERM system-associated outer membrane protein [Burkholderiales bacterium]|nr:TIGR03016 family PEP-CTERM system-associated outer membrane protein [Burkholderiales bacterium]
MATAATATATDTALKPAKGTSAIDTTPTVRIGLIGKAGHGAWRGAQPWLAALITNATLSGSLAAAEWRIIPRISLLETYTDNLTLAPEGQERSDWVTEIHPGVSVTARGARLQLQANYALQNRIYMNNSNANGHNHSLMSNALLDAWNRQLFVAASAAISQQNISPLGAQALSNVNVTGNRTEVRSASLAPYWQGRIGSWATLNARYSWNRVETSGATSALNSEANGISVGLASGPAFQDLGWGLNYSIRQTDSSSGAVAKNESESATGSLRYRVWPTLALTATAGREQNDHVRTRGSASGTTWSAGAHWTPSERTSVSGSFGHRFFGRTFSLDASHRTRLTTWTAGYSEQVLDAATNPLLIPASADTSVAIDRLLLARIPDPLERQLAVQAFILQNGLPQSLDNPIQFLTNQISISKRWHAGVGLLGVRSSLLVNFFRDERTNESSGSSFGAFDPFAISNTVEQVGYSAVLSWRLSNRSAVSATVGQNRSRFPDVGREDTNQYARVGLTYQLQPKVHSGVNLRVVERDSSAGNSDYREHAVIGTLSVAF